MHLSFSTIWPNFYCLFGRKSCFLYLTFLVFVGCIWKGALRLTQGVPLEKQSPDLSVNHRDALRNAWGNSQPWKQDPELRCFCLSWDAFVPQPGGYSHQAHRRQWLTSFSHQCTGAGFPLGLFSYVVLVFSFLCTFASTAPPVLLSSRGISLRFFKYCMVAMHLF